MKKFLLVIIMSSIVHNYYCQIDTEFWFVAPEVSIHGSNFLDRPIVVKITSFDSPADIEISIPAQPGITPITATIPANMSQTFNLTPWIDNLENIPSNTILNKGLKITSNSRVTAYYEVISGGEGFSLPKNNPEAFVLKGKNALGTEFYIPSQNLVENSLTYTPSPRNVFDIVATEDNTAIVITASNAIVGHPAGTTFTITLNKGQTYSARAVGNLPSQHLNGSHVTSDKPIAITVTDDLLFGPFFGGGGCADLVGDQIIPVSQIGNKYIATKTQLAGPGDYLFITATQNGTNVYKDGNPIAICTLNAGETCNFAIGTGQSTYIESNNPVYVWQLAGSGCELGASILPSIDCTGSSEVSYVRSSDYELYINLLTRNENISDFYINGNALSGTIFSSVPGTSGEWMTAIIFMSITDYPYNSVINVTNTSGVFHLSTTDINGGGTSYGYFSNYGNIILNENENINICIGDTIKLTGSDMEDATHLWTGPGGFSSTEKNVTIPNAASVHSGWYYYTLSSYNCSGMDSVYVTVVADPIIDFNISDTGICKNQEVRIKFNKQTSESVKITPDIWSSIDDINFTANPQETTEFIIELTNSSGCMNYGKFMIHVDTIPVLNVKAEDTIIGCLTNHTKLFAENAVRYSWQPYELCDNSFSASPVVYPLSRTTFIVTGTTKFGCVAKDSITIDFSYEGYELIPNAFSPNGDGLNDRFKPFIYCIYYFKSLRVYNRYGEMIFITHDQNIGWDGTNGKENEYYDSGVYYWIITGIDINGREIERKGDVTLIR